MGSFCAYQGIVGIHTSEPYIYSDCRYCKHGTILPVMQTDLPVDVLIFVGEAAATKDSIYCVAARTILQPNLKSGEGAFQLQLFAKSSTVSNGFFLPFVLMCRLQPFNLYLQMHMRY